MLIELFGENFGCFRDEFRLSLLASEIDPGSERGILEAELDGESNPLRLLRAVALYGANASGKSRIILAALALRFLLDASGRLQSDEALGPYEPYALGPEKKAPVRLGVVAVIARAVYRYEVSFTRREIQRERLHQLGADNQVIRVLFERHQQEVQGDWRKDPQFALLEKGFRRNALLLSLADAVAPRLAKKIAASLRFLLAPNLDAAFWGAGFWLQEHAQQRVAKQVHADPKFRDWLLARLKSADVGVVDLRAEEVVEYQEIHSADAAESDAPAQRVAERRSHRLILLHGGAAGATPLPYRSESRGTQRLVELALLLHDLERGKRPRAAFIDELDCSMHPLLLEALVRRFNCEIPPAEARSQLIFTAHETSLLEGEARDAVLRRDQIYFTEKGRDGASRLYSLAEYGERQNLNIRRRYLQGRYGALPAISSVRE